MTPTQINKLLGVEVKTLNNWKNDNRTELYDLLSSLDYESAKKLLTTGNKEAYVRVLENEKYFDLQLDFEKELYPLLLNRDVNVWKRLSRDTSLSRQARLRSAYLYVYLSKKPLKLSFNLERYKGNFSFFHKTKSEDGDGYARMFGLKNGLDNMRFNQYKNTGVF